jgi:hypothetical protein
MEQHTEAAAEVRHKGSVIIQATKGVRRMEQAFTKWHHNEVTAKKPHIRLKEHN